MRCQSLTSTARYELSVRHVRLVAENIPTQWYGNGYFYEWSNVTALFDNRLKHIMNHKYVLAMVPRLWHLLRLL
jgi:hypothetical protein